MTVLADFNIIIGDVALGFGITPQAKQQLGEFNTGGRIRSDGEVGGNAAFLMFSVEGVQVAIDVFINGQKITGPITPTTPGWHTQIIALAGSRLNDGNNEITVGLPDGATATTSFQMKDLICFYHQDSD
jgi:hypothetical protein